MHLFYLYLSILGNKDEKDKIATSLAPRNDRRDLRASVTGTVPVTHDGVREDEEVAVSLRSCLPLLYRIFPHTVYKHNNSAWKIPSASFISQYPHYHQLSRSGYSDTEPFALILFPPDRQCPQFPVQMIYQVWPLEDCI